MANRHAPGGEDRRGRQERHMSDDSFHLSPRSLGDAHQKIISASVAKDALVTSTKCFVSVNDLGGRVAEKRSMIAFGIRPDLPSLMVIGTPGALSLEKPT